MNLVTIIELEQTQLISIQLTEYSTPLWKITLWKNANSPSLSFFDAPNDLYPISGFPLTSFIVDNFFYLKTNSIAECIETPESWYFDLNNSSIVYVHFANHRPHFLFYSKQTGFIMGFTNNGFMKLSMNQQAKELVLSVPPYQIKTDILEYKKMVFTSGTITLDNSGGDFNNIANVFGNNLMVRLGLKGDSYENYKNIAQYYVANYSLTAEKATFHGKDKRELLSRKAPNTRFARTNIPGDATLYVPGLVYPFIGDSLIDQIIPDAYGYCFRVEGHCVNENQATTDRWRHFKFARHITPDTLTALTASSVISGNTCLNSNFILEAQIGKKWVRLPRNASEFNALGMQGTYDPATMWIAVGPVSYNSYNPVTGVTTPVNWTEEGTVTIPVIWAHDQEGQTWATDVEGGINAVRLTARFNPQENPLDIILDVLSYYGDIASTEAQFNLNEMNSELRKLPSIGIALTEEKDLYAIIEQFQNGSLLGFQLISQFDRFSAKLDNPNRPESFRLSASLILNYNELTIDFGGTSYATWVEVIYAYGYQDKKGLRSIDKSYQTSLLNIHRFDKVYTIQSNLPDKANADLKASVLMSIFNAQLITIKNIKLFGFEWFDLDLFQIGTLDLQGIKGRAIFSAAALRVQIIKVAKDPISGIVTIDVVQRQIVPNLPPEYSI